MIVPWPWLGMISLTIIIAVTAFHHSDRSPSFGYSIIGKAAYNIIVVLIATLATVLAWAVFLVARY